MNCAVHLLVTHGVIFRWYQAIDAGDEAIVGGRKIYYKSHLSSVFMGSDAYGIYSIVGGGEWADHEASELRKLLTTTGSLTAENKLLQM